MAVARSTNVIRALDAKGRLQLPLDADAATKLPAERDGALITVFLPGSSEQPRPGYATAALSLDARGRLTVTAGGIRLLRESGSDGGGQLGHRNTAGRRFYPSAAAVDGSYYICETPADGFAAPDRGGLRSADR
ncbi:hypothetical protein SAMN05660350_00794 [Geodermatophilus obscurus]|uniref:Uncharacterized protein n=1 Tax=Geodermatophilus obscurus TaxID=1861 RepID=A0A1M7SJJ5_9ACTN|nr:hypothetical protein [Geodermatophilus obscurus]SHN58646.1 hypothetical protein SAMN05660350_00794 [Geodermatophilus obscurus]